MSETATPPPAGLPPPFLRVAIVHEWLVTFAGSERALRALLALYPQADLFAVVDFLSDSDRARLGGRRATTTFIQKLPGAAKRYRSYLPLMPLAIEQLDMSGYDLVISSNHAVAKGVLTGPDQVHICYCYTPIRYAWDLQHEYLREGGITRGPKLALARLFLHYIRLWDMRTAAGVDRFVAISHFIARRISKVYGRTADVIYAPVDISSYSLCTEKEDYYFAASRMVPYKRMDLIVEAFNAMPEKKLVVIGDGPEYARIAKLAGPNVMMLGYQDDATMRAHLQKAKAFVFAAQEDQGLLPIEAQACGTPVIAYGRGGSAETVVGLDDAAGRPPTGVFFAAQTVNALTAAVARFEAEGKAITATACRAHAEGFSVEKFHRHFRDLVNDQMAGHRLAPT